MEAEAASPEDRGEDTPFKSAPPYSTDRRIVQKLRKIMIMEFAEFLYCLIFYEIKYRCKVQAVRSTVSLKSRINRHTLSRI